GGNKVMNRIACQNLRLSPLNAANPRFDFFILAEWHPSREVSVALNFRQAVTASKNGVALPREDAAEHRGLGFAGRMQGAPKASIPAPTRREPRAVSNGWKQFHGV